MKILWICNIPTPEASIKFKLPLLYTGGWLTGLSTELAKKDNINLIYSFPLDGIKNLQYNNSSQITYYAIPRKKSKPTVYDSSIEGFIKELIKSTNPDIVHIFGTELPLALSAIKVIDNKKSVISIQGMTSIYERYYSAELPYKVINSKTLYEFIKGGSIKKQTKFFYKRGLFEIKAIESVYNIIGRTDWDEACTHLINPQINYFKCNETLRPMFYDFKWDIENIERYSIFLSQAIYPIKGLHFVIEAINILITKYPNLKLFIGGSNIFYPTSLKGKLKLSSYGQYIKSLIKKFNLKEHIYFTGPLNESEIINHYLNAHVFVCPSSIENSPNSLGEAMLLGVPCVASYVGGIPSMLEHSKEGFLYQYNAPYMMAYYIDKIFKDNNLALLLSKNAKLKAEITHSREKNTKDLIKIYYNILESRTND